jgi:hypothetical protein
VGLDPIRHVRRSLFRVGLDLLDHVDGLVGLGGGSLLA